MMACLRLVDDLDLTTITTPTWIGYSTADRVVSSLATERVFAELGSTLREIVPLDGGADPSHHILAGQVLAPKMTEPVAAQVIAFVKESRRK